MKKGFAQNDMDVVEDIAEHIQLPYNRNEIFNRLSRLPKNKVKMKRAIKQRMQELASMYISLATFIDDDEVDYMQENLGTKKSKEIARRVIREIDELTKDMNKFKPLNHL